jgi:two-component system phosphate regulon sensor histidine kinase PhoR
MADDALTQARAMLDELTEAARKGAIIPIRLTGQLEAIAQKIAEAEDERAAQAQKSAVPADMESFLKENASFISHAIHELRTPMTSIRGYADMLGTPSMGELNGMQQQFLSTIRTNARRMESLMQDVSDISKLRGGTFKINPKMDMFKNIGLMVEKQMRPLADEMHKTLTFDIPSGLPLLNVDGEMLAKALDKLIENALRYTPENGEVRVVASGEGSKLRIDIQDNGIGMTPEEIAQLGTIYFRSENDTVRAHKGSGLGVPIAYGLIREMGGTVDVTSQPGEGTTFTVTLPGMA